MKIGIGLEGGGVRCVAQAGILEVLFASGIQPDCYAGVGAGALVAAMAATDNLTEEAIAMAKAAYRNASLRNMAVFKRLKEQFGGISLRDAHRLALPTVDLETGAVQVLASMLPLMPDPRPWSRQALISCAVRAAMATPGVLPPMGWRGHRLIGGGFLRATLPTVLRAMGADRVVILRVLDVGCAQFETHPAAQAICAHATVMAPPPHCDLVISVDGYSPIHGVLDRRGADVFYQAGRTAALKALPTLEMLIGAKNGKILLFPGAEECNLP